MSKKPKSFRFLDDDLKKLQLIHDYYKNGHKHKMTTLNMDNLHRWSEAQTLAVLIRNEYLRLKDEGSIEN